MAYMHLLAITASLLLIFSAIGVGAQQVATTIPQISQTQIGGSGSQLGTTLPIIAIAVIAAIVVGYLASARRRRRRR